MHWTEPYIGIPWLSGGRESVTGLDCWGLLCHVYAREYGITLAPYTEHVEGCPQVFEPLLAELVTQHWKPTDSPQDGDAVAVGRKDRLSHVGLYVQLREPAILHSQVNNLSSIITLRLLRKTGWTNIKFYRNDLRH